MLHRVVLFAIAITASAVNAGCVGCTHVEPGHVGVLIESCSGGGVQNDPVGVGYHSTGPCTSIVEYPTNVQTANWTANPREGREGRNDEITFTNADQMQISVDVSIAYQLDPAKVPAFYSKFKADPLSDFTYGFMHNLAREKFDAAGGKYKIEQIMGDNATFLAEVRAALQKDLTPYGITISQFGFIGAPRPPKNVVDAINAKLAATQKAIQLENELRQSEAEAKKHVAQAEGEAQAIKAKADAEAYANQKVTSSLSPTLIEYIRSKKWDGKLPQVTGQTTPFINLSK